MTKMCMASGQLPLVAGKAGIEPTNHDVKDRCLNRLATSQDMRVIYRTLDGPEKQKTKNEWLVVR